MENRDLKILYVTQKVSVDDDLLGMVYGWLEDLAKKVDKLYVICLEKGKVNLPENCQVFSLGKERGASTLRYVVNFYKFAAPLLLKRKVDGIFVHMNQVYIFLLLPFRLLGIPIIWWKSHSQLSWSGRFARFFVDRIATTANVSFPVKTFKKRVIGHGVDINIFRSFTNASHQSGAIEIVAVGRISPVRKYELLFKAVRKVLNDLPAVKLKVKVYGKIPLLRQKSYFNDLMEQKNRLNLENIVFFEGSVPNHQIPNILNQADFVVNPGGSHSLDKVAVESMACEKIVIDSNLATLEILQKSDVTTEEKSLFLFKSDDYEDLAEKIKNMIEIDERKKTVIEKKLRRFVEKYHNVDYFNNQLLSIFNELICPK